MTVIIFKSALATVNVLEKFVGYDVDLIRMHCLLIDD